MKKSEEFETGENSKSVVKIYERTIVYKLICVIIGFINSIIINRCLGVALRGDYTTIINWASLLQLILNLGIGTSYPALKRKYPDSSKTIYTTIAFPIIMVYSGIVATSFLLKTLEVRLILILTCVTTGENIFTFIAIVEDVIKKNIITLIIAAAHTMTLLFIFFSFPQNLSAVIGAVIVDHVVICVSFIISYRIKEIDFKLLNKSILKETFSIAIPAMLMNALMYLNYHADVLFLSQMTRNSVLIGLYGTAVTLGNMLWIIPDAFKDILYNRAAKKDNPKEVSIAIFCNFFLCIIILIGFVVLGKWFLKTVYGNDYVAAYPLTLTLFVGTFPMILYKLIHPIYIANGKTKIVVALLAIAVAVNIMGNIILIPCYEGMGAAVSSVISYSICGMAFLFKFYGDYKISFLDVLSEVGKYIKK